MFQFTGFLYPPYVFRREWYGMTRTRFTYSEIRGSKLAWQLPRLIAACNVLFGFQRQGIHRVPF